MNKFLSLKFILLELWGLLSKKRKKQYIALFILSIIVSISEIVSIGAIFPFLAILTNQDSLLNNSEFRAIFALFSIHSPNELIKFVVLFFGFASVLSAGMRVIYIWATAHLSYMSGADLSAELFRRTLYQPYASQIKINSSDLIDSIFSKSLSVTYTFMYILQILGSVVVAISIFIVMLLINPIVAIATFTSLTLIYCFILLGTRKKVLSDGELIATESSASMKSIQEGLGGIRDVLIEGTQEIFCDIFKSANKNLRRAQARSQFTGQYPRYILEALVMTLVAFTGYILSGYPDGLSKAIPIIGTLALATQRLLPVVQQAYASFSSLLSLRASVKDALEIFYKPMPQYLNYKIDGKKFFKRNISLKNLCFRYDEYKPFVLKNIDLEIKKGSVIGIIGSTGSGKSTLVDIIMGLLYPTSGELNIDGRKITGEKLYKSWQSKITHVPQSIFLTDATVSQNIAFGIPMNLIDMKKVALAAAQAQIAQTIESWPEKYNTIIGERGVLLSGGQRQRIGIARAFYRKAELIIFDEATSALDDKTQQAVIKSISKLDKQVTIILIAHRLSTLKNCNVIIKLKNGKITKVRN